VSRLVNGGVEQARKYDSLLDVLERRLHDAGAKPGTGGVKFERALGGLPREENGRDSAFGAGRLVARQRARREKSRGELLAAWGRLERAGRRAWR
jgi:hypothetical protein